MASPRVMLGPQRVTALLAFGCAVTIAALAATWLTTQRTLESIDTALQQDIALGVARAHIDFLEFRGALDRGEPELVRERYAVLARRAGSVAALYQRVPREDIEHAVLATLADFVIQADAAFDRAAPRAPMAQLRALTPVMGDSLQFLDNASMARSNAARSRIEAEMRAAASDTRNLAMFFAVITAAFCAALIGAVGQLMLKNRHLAAMSERMSSLANFRRQFLANASHEFRTPLNAIQGFAQIIQHMGDDMPAERRREYVDDIVHSASLLERLTDDLLELSQIDADQFYLREELLDLDALTARAARTLAPRAEEAGLTLTVEAEAGVTVLADGAALERALTNLLSNAVKFTEAGRAIHVACRMERGAPVIEVADQGCGVPEDERDAIWELYGRSSLTRHNDRQGAGLGLPICRAIIEAHGGELSMASEVGVGSVFTLRLPASRVEGVVEATAMMAAA